MSKIAIRKLSFMDRFEELFYLQGLEEHAAFNGKRAVRLACEYPELVDYVDFYIDGEKIYRSYDEPFYAARETTWLATPHCVLERERKWEAAITLTDGSTILKSAIEPSG